MIGIEDHIAAMFVLVLLAQVIVRYALPLRSLRWEAGVFTLLVYALLGVWNPLPAFAMGVVYVTLAAAVRFMTGVFGEDGDPAARRLAVLVSGEVLVALGLLGVLWLFDGSTGALIGGLRWHAPWLIATDGGLVDAGRIGVGIVVLGYLITTLVGSAVIRIAIAPFEAQIREQRRADEAGRGLRDAGRAIGLLESTVIYVLVITGNAPGVGFLIAAKSIFRFGELRDSANRKEAEYFLIGTLMSFAWSLAISAAVVWIV